LGSTWIRRRSFFSKILNELLVGWTISLPVPEIIAIEIWPNVWMTLNFIDDHNHETLLNSLPSSAENFPETLKKIASLSRTPERQGR